MSVNFKLLWYGLTFVVSLLYADVVFATLEHAPESDSLRYYKGRVNDVHDVFLILEENKNNVFTGKWIYLSTGEEFEVKGERTGLSLSLKEFKGDGVITGFLEGKFYNNTFSGTWSNYNDRIGASFELFQINQKDLSKTECGSNKWLRIYQGIWNDEEVKLLLQRKEEGRLKGWFWIGSQYRRIQVSGELNDLLALEMVDDNLNEVGTIQGKVTDKAIEVSIELDNKTQELSLKQTEAFKVNCEELMDYQSTYSISYPNVGLKKFDTYISFLIDAELKKLKEHSEKVAIENLEDLTPDHRAKLRAYSWWNIEHKDDRVISGHINMSSTWTDNHRIVFSYDLKKDNLILLEDLFEYKDSRFFEVARELILKELEGRPYAQDSYYLPWVKEQAFTFVTIRSEGIHFSTAYNGLYGAQGVTIPYEELEEFIISGSVAEYYYQLKTK